MLHTARDPKTVSSRPITVQIDLTNKCNLRCGMCHFADDNVFYAPRVEIEPERFREFAAEVLPRTQKVMLSCGTEPLVAKGFRQALGIVREFGVPHLEFTTNATLFNDANLRAIFENRVDRIQISIDGVRKNTYDTIRTGAKYENVIANIKKLKGLKEKLGVSTPRIQLNLVLFRFNIEEAESFVQMAHELGATELDFRHVTLHPAMGVDDQSLWHHKALSNHHLSRAYRRAEELGVHFAERPSLFTLDEDEQKRFEELERGEAAPLMDEWRSVPEPALPDIELSEKELPFDETADRFGHHPGHVLKELHETLAASEEELLRGYDRCPLAFEYTVVRSDGHVFPCPFWTHDGEMGNIHEQGFDEIWKGERYTNLRRSLIEGDLMTPCRHCPTFGRGSVDDPEAFRDRVF